MMTARIESVGNAATAGVAAEIAVRAPPVSSSSASSTTTEGQSSELSPSLSDARDSGRAGTRLENTERQMAKMRLDLGELMVVYDDMQVGGWLLEVYMYMHVDAIILIHWIHNNVKICIFVNYFVT